MSSLRRLLTLMLTLAGIIAGLTVHPARSAAASAPSLWSVYKERFVTPEGRVVDTGNGDISHSEGQGFALFLAVTHGDREGFERIWKWTDRNLRVRTDRLFAWRWRPARTGGESGAVDDYNNASDGDLLIAWALHRAAKLWEIAEYRASATELAREIRTRLLRATSIGPVLLPGAHGFESPEGIVVNLSYWVFPAFGELNEIDPSAQWKELTASGLALHEHGRFGKWKLPPEWLLISEKGLRVAPNFESVFGYNAIRVPLYLAWSGRSSPADLGSYRAYHRSFPGSLKATVDLHTNQPGADDALAGMRAIYALLESGDGRESGPGNKRAPYRAIAADEAYYSASLGLLANAAALAASNHQTPPQPKRNENQQ